MHIRSVVDGNMEGRITKVSYHNAISGDKVETNELRESGEKRESFPLSEGLVNPVSREVTGRISGRERHGQLRKIDDRGERERV